MADLLKEWSSVIGSLLAIAGFIAMLSKKGRGVVSSWWELRKKKKGMPALLEEIASDVVLVKKEVMFNGGGSVKDAVIRIERGMANEFWLRPQPAFICDSEGRNLRVTEAYCSLVGVRNLQELESVSWRLFIHTEYLDDYDATWREALSNGSHANGRARFQTLNGVDRGMWKVRIMPLEQIVKPDGTSSWTFTGYFYHTDELSRSIWEEQHWK